MLAVPAPARARCGCPRALAATVPPGRHRSYGAAADARKGESVPISSHGILPNFVIDEQQRLYGSIAFEDLADAAFEPDRAGLVTARDLVHRTPVAPVLAYNRALLEARAAERGES